MTIPELNERLDNVINNLPNELGKIMLNVGNTARSVIQERIKKSGINAEGNKFPAYSQTPMLANCRSMTVAACSKIASSKDKRRELKWVTIKRGGKNIKLFEIPGGYKQYRELHGRQTGFVDFAFNGRMWENIGIISNNGEHNTGVVRISARNEDDMKKLEGNTNRKGTILDLSRAEVGQLCDDYSKALKEYFNKKGL